MRNIDVWWGTGGKRECQLVDTAENGKKIMRLKKKSGYEDIVMYAQHPTNDDDTFTYVFKGNKIIKEKL